MKRSIVTILAASTAAPSIIDRSASFGGMSMNNAGGYLDRLTMPEAIPMAVPVSGYQVDTCEPQSEVHTATVSPNHHHHNHQYRDEYERQFAHQNLAPMTSSGASLPSNANNIVFHSTDYNGMSGVVSQSSSGVANAIANVASSGATFETRKDPFVPKEVVDCAPPVATMSSVAVATAGHVPPASDTANPYSVQVATTCSTQAPPTGKPVNSPFAPFVTEPSNERREQVECHRQSPAPTPQPFVHNRGVDFGGNDNDSAPPLSPPGEIVGNSFSPFAKRHAMAVAAGNTAPGLGSTDSVHRPLCPNNVVSPNRPRQQPTELVQSANTSPSTWPAQEVAAQGREGAAGNNRGIDDTLFGHSGEYCNMNPGQRSFSEVSAKPSTEPVSHESRNFLSYPQPVQQVAASVHASTLFGRSVELGSTESVQPHPLRTNTSTPNPTEPVPHKSRNLSSLSQPVQQVAASGHTRTTLFGRELGNLDTVQRPFRPSLSTPNPDQPVPRKSPIMQQPVHQQVTASGQEAAYRPAAETVAAATFGSGPAVSNIGGSGAVPGVESSRNTETKLDGFSVVVDKSPSSQQAPVVPTQPVYQFRAPDVVMDKLMKAVADKAGAPDELKDVFDDLIDSLKLEMKLVKQSLSGGG